MGVFSGISISRVRGGIVKEGGRMYQVALTGSPWYVNRGGKKKKRKNISKKQVNRLYSYAGLGKGVKETERKETSRRLRTRRKPWLLEGKKL